MDNASFETNHGWRILRSFLVVLIIAGALYSGFFFFSTVRAIVARANIPFVENVVRTSAIQGESPIQKQEVPDVVVKKERVTILLLGVDQREIESGPTRTDTMILISVDPATNTAAMLSIPRDLWVTIPGYGENRINTAHFLGDANKYPGGGPALAKKTVWYDLGVPVNYYVRINFGAFEKLIDAIGGVTLDVKTAIHDTAYPDSNYGYMTVDIPAGVQHMDGKTALQYARTRHGNSDFDRMARQRAVILAARDKVLSLNIPLARIPELLATLGNSVQTDMNVDEMLALAQTAKEMDRDNLRQGGIDATMTSSVVTPQGWAVEVPDWEKIRKLVDELFPAPVPAALPTPTSTPLPTATATRKG